MTEEPFGYADLNHAVLARDIGTTRLKNPPASADAEIFALSVRGECASGGHEHEHAVLLLLESAVGVIAQLTTRLLQSGITEEELRRLLTEEIARVADDDIRAGYLVRGCDVCGRAEPECMCLNKWAVR